MVKQNLPKILAFHPINVCVYPILMFFFYKNKNRKKTKKQRGTISVMTLLYLSSSRQHFEHIMLPVWMINCLEPDEYGVAQYCVPALMYIAQDEWTSPGRQPLNRTRKCQICPTARLDIGKRFKKTNITQTVPNVSSYVP